MYTGDQIAYACSRDLGTSLDAVYRTLVGKELSPQLQAAGLIKQAHRVRTSFILRFSQLFRPVPHSTNRFLNLLRFAEKVQPESATDFRAALPAAAVAPLDKALKRAARDERRRFGAAVTTCGAVAVGALMIYAGFMVGNAPRSSSSDIGLTGLTPVDTTTPTQPTPTSTQPTPTPGQALIDAVPASLGGSCAENTAPPAGFVGLRAAVTCFGVKASAADRVEVYQFDSSESMSDGVDLWLGNLAPGDCVNGLRDRWTANGDYRGTLACYVAQTGESVAVWTIDDDAILIAATDRDMGLTELYTWWQQATPASLRS